MRAGVRWCVERWNRSGNATLRAEVATHRLTSRAYVYRVDRFEARTSVDLPMIAGESALTFAGDQVEQINVLWFLEQGSTGGLRQVDAMSGPFLTDIEPGSAGVGTDGTLHRT